MKKLRIFNKSCDNQDIGDDIKSFVTISLMWSKILAIQGPFLMKTIFCHQRLIVTYIVLVTTL